MKRSGRTLAIGGASVLLLALASATVLATGDGDKPRSGKPHVETSEVPIVQESLDAVAEDLRRFSDRAGYGGLAYDIPSRSINLWWKGDLDPDARATIESLPGNVAVNIHAARFSRIELGRAINKIAGTKARDGSYEVQMVTEEDAHRPTFVYGLIVIAKLGPGASKDRVESTLSRLAGVPVTLSDEPMPQGSPLILTPSPHP